MRTAHPYPFTNLWRKGSWVGRPNGKADRDYTYQRDFCNGTPDKASGTLRYTLADLGGPGWVVARDPIRGTRNLIELRELEWVEHPEVPPADVLAVVRAGSWDGTVCDTHGRAIIADRECADCDTDQETDERRLAYAAAAPTVEPF